MDEQGAGNVGGDRWTQLQNNDSLGHGPETSARGSLPVTFSQAAPGAAPQAPPPQQQRSLLGSGLPRPSGSETDALSSSAVSSSSTGMMPTSLSMGSISRSAGGSGEVGVGAGSGSGSAAVAGLEETVGREVSRRLSAVEDRLGAVMERLEAFLDAADASPETK